jgi:hypothetical protein
MKGTEENPGKEMAQPGFARGIDAAPQNFIPALIASLDSSLLSC